MSRCVRKVNTPNMIPVIGHVSRLDDFKFKTTIEVLYHPGSHQSHHL
jgi:hypothetical protein